MTYNEIIHFIAARYQRPYDDVFMQEIGFAAKFWRSYLIRQDAERNGQSAEYTQTITVPLVPVDAADSCYVEIGCMIMKTEKKIPLPLNMKGGGPFNYVGIPGMKKSFGWKMQSTISFAMLGRWIKGPFYTMSNGFLYVWGNNKIDYLTISGVFADPEEAVEPCIDSERCFNPDEPWPLASHLLKMLIGGLLDGTFSLKPVKQEINLADEQPVS